jgi:glutamine synthetase
MGKYTKEDILRIAKENDVEFVRLQFTDIFGKIKNVAITSRQLDKILDNGIMFDGSSIEGFVRINESDMYLKPDFDTFAVLPWKEKMARIICDVYCTDGTPFMGDPRNLLKKVVAEAKEMGFEFNVGPECEFFLFELDENNNPTTNTDDVASYFDIGPSDTGEQCRRGICLALESMGFEIEASHHENAPGQHEIDFRFDEAIATADNVITFKHIVRTYARRHDLHATFMPKPLFGECGSGMHTNMSLTKDGKNAFCDENDELGLSEIAYQFIAGVLDHIKGITAVANPLVNSYKRLVSGYEAPVYISWSASNRSALIRVPTARGEGTRIELRSPDPSCNPYLEMALCLAAGLDGIKRSLKAPKQVEGNIYEMSFDDFEKNHIDCLPASLEEAIIELEKDEFLKNTLGEHIFEKYVAGKKREWDKYRTAITDWEINRYLTKY